MTTQTAGKRLRRRESKEQTRNRLLDAAAAVFAQKGYAAASVDDVADAAGYTKGAVYSNFASKTDLFMALIDRRIERQVAASRQAIGGLTLEDAMRVLEAQASGATLDDATREWLLLTVEFWLGAMRDERAREALAAKYERARTETAALFTSMYAKAGRPLPMPARDLAMFTEAVGIGLAMQAVIDPKAVSMGLQAEVLRLILGGEPAGGRRAENGSAAQAGPLTEDRPLPPDGRLTEHSPSPADLPSPDA